MILSGEYITLSKIHISREKELLDQFKFVHVIEIYQKIYLLNNYNANTEIIWQKGGKIIIKYSKSAMHKSVVYVPRIYIAHKIVKGKI